MADETVKIDLQVIDNTPASIQNLKELKRLLRSLPADSEAFGAVSRKIGDIEDAVKGAKQGTSDLVDTLASAPGPLGAVGRGLNTLKISTVSFGAALKASGIGLLVTTIAGIAGAFSQNEEVMKKLEPLWIGLQRILGGIMEVFTPLLDAFIELALKVLPYASKALGIYYSGLVAFFTLVKEAGAGVGKILIGIFTLDTKQITEGWEQIKGSWGKTVAAYEAGVTRYETGTKKLTKTEKENAKERQEALDKEYEALVKRNDDIAKLQDARLEKAKAIALALSTTEQEKLNVEILFAQKSYDQQRKALEDRIALAKKYGKDTTDLQTQLIQLETKFIEAKTTNADKQKEIDKKLYADLSEARKSNYEATLLLNKQVEDEDKYKLNRALTAGKNYLNVVGKNSKEIQDILVAAQADQIINEITYQQTLNKIAIDAAEKRKAEADALFEQQRADLKAQYDARLVDQEEYRKKSTEIDKNQIEENQKFVDLVQASEINKINALTELRDKAAESEKELLQIRLDSYRTYADGLAAVFNYVAGLQRDASAEQVLLAKIAVYIQSAAAVADVILKARAAYASYAKAAATAGATIAEGAALTSNPLTAPVGIAMLAAGKASLVAAKAGMVATVVGGVAQTAIIAANTATQIQAIDSAAKGSGSGASAGAGGGGAGGSAATPAFANATIAAPQIGASQAQQGTIAGIVAGTLAANNSNARPIRAYVVGNDITSEQQLQRRIKTAARLGG